LLFVDAQALRSVGAFKDEVAAKKDIFLASPDGQSQPQTTAGVRSAKTRPRLRSVVTLQEFLLAYKEQPELPGWVEMLADNYEESGPRPAASLAVAAQKQQQKKSMSTAELNLNFETLTTLAFDANGKPLLPKKPNPAVSARCIARKGGARKGGQCQPTHFSLAACCRPAFAVWCSSPTLRVQRVQECCGTGCKACVWVVYWEKVGAPAYCRCRAMVHRHSLAWCVLRVACSVLRVASSWIAARRTR
jgi:hypothetical protein